jgi:hypothetical protein
MVIVEKLVEWSLAGETEMYAEKKPAPAPLCPPQNPTWLEAGVNPGSRGGKPATNRLSYGAAKTVPFHFEYFAMVLTSGIQSYSGRWMVNWKGFVNKK